MALAPSAGAVLATIYTLITIAAAMIVARVYLRLVIQKARLLVSDIIMIVAWCAAVSTASFDIVFEKTGILSPDIYYPLVNFHAPPEALSYILKMTWASVIPFFSTIYLSKASLLATYFQLFPIFMRKRRIMLWVVSIYVAMAYVVSVSLQLFLCMPIERNWEAINPANLCPVTAPKVVFNVAWSLHFVGSVAVFALPFSILSNITLSRKMRIAVYSVFLLGLIDIAFTLTRFLTIKLSSTQGILRPMTMIELWSSLEAYVGLIVACLPSLRPFLRHNWKATRDYNSYENQDRPIRSDPSRRREQSGFTEIDDASYMGASGLAASQRNGSNAGSDREFESELEDKERNQSVIELVTINTGSPGHERAHV